jgi:predicted ATPase
MTQTTDRPEQSVPNQSAKSFGFTAIGVRGFKSFVEETRIQFGSLTILAGANSSGKSSIMQPLLLMKQTLEAPYDPGALLLDGPNVSFTSGDQLLSKVKLQTPSAQQWAVAIDLGLMNLRSVFQWSLSNGFSIQSQTTIDRPQDEEIELFPDMSPEKIHNILLKDLGDRRPKHLAVFRDRCFLNVKFDRSRYDFGVAFEQFINPIIHVRGLRGTPERTYNTSAVNGAVFMGQFEKYVASLIDRFQKENPEKLIKLQQALQKLGLTDIIQAQRLNDTQIELRVGRVLGQADPTDTVNIADVGFGVSQVLPVIVALLVAEPEQMVYIEQPEIHLHPRAQVALSEIFADAANRGVRVVVETHSELFLMGIQALVAEDKLDSNAVKLHWFSRQSDGSSKVTSADLDETGAFGDWPEDFGSIALDMANRYLSAAEAKLWNSHSGNSSHG